jgi:hypothetical protein
MFNGDYNDSGPSFRIDQIGIARRLLIIYQSGSVFATSCAASTALHLKCGFCSCWVCFHMRNSKIFKTLSIAIISIYSFLISDKQTRPLPSVYWREERSTRGGRKGELRGGRERREEGERGHALPGLWHPRVPRWFESICFCLLFIYAFMSEYPLICILCKRNL